jgi:hypothetical protein
MHKVIFYSIIGVFLPISQNTLSQVTTSPYSVFGIGNLEVSSIGDTRAMGGTGIAFMSAGSLNLLNPASYDGLDSLLTITEVGLFGKYSSFKNTLANQSLFNANFKYMVLGFRLSPRLATSFGIMPYSSVGYSIKSSVNIIGTDQLYTKTFSGEGGVNNLFLGGSYRLTKDLIFGMNVNYLFGNVTHSESSSDFYYLIDDVTYLSNININYGLDYRFKMKSWNYGIGFIYNNGKKLTSKNVLSITTDNTTEVLKSKNKIFTIPQTMGIGLEFAKNYFRGGIDYELDRWNKVDLTTNVHLKIRNANRYSVGFEFPSQGLRQVSGNMLFYRFGATYSQSYIIIDNVPINCMSVSCGLGLPVKKDLNVINISLEAGQNGTMNEGMIKEIFYTLHIDLSLKELWFVKHKYN